MSARDVFNRYLINCGYEIVKSSRYGDSQIELDNAVIAARVDPNRKHLWLVAPPKSGSTWLTAMVSQLLQWPIVALTNGHGRREQEVDLRPILRYPSGNILSPQQHCSASQQTTDFIKQFHVTPVVQTRRLLDSVVSFRDHLLNETLEIPMAHLTRRFFDMGEEQQFDLIVDLVVPWYLNFYASWFVNEDLAPGQVLFVGYEEMLEQPEEILKKVLRHIGEPKSDAEIHRVVAGTDGSKTRKNKGVAGRGEQMLNARHKAKIKSLLGYYDHVDFSRIGC